MRLHLRHVRDLLRSLDPTDAYNGVNCSSLSYLSYFTQTAMGRVPYCLFTFRHSQLPSCPLCVFSDTDSLGIGKASNKESVDWRPPDYILPCCKDILLVPLQPIREDRKVCVFVSNVHLIFTLYASKLLILIVKNKIKNVITWLCMYFSFPTLIHICLFYMFNVWL